MIPPSPSTNDLLASPPIHWQQVDWRAGDPWPAGFRLSVVVPIYNERATILQVIERIRASAVPLEMILVDDGSRDGTRALLEALSPADDLRLLLHPRNRGKGAALHTGFAAAQGGVVVVQDADLEYDPKDWPRLLEPLIRGEADVVYGSRFLELPPGLVTWHVRVNRLLTWLSNWTTGLRLSDMETCYKVLRCDVLHRVLPNLREERFGIEPELTARLARLPGLRLREIPIRYAGRSYAQGKKITWRDGLSALRCIARYGLGK